MKANLILQALAVLCSVLAWATADAQNFERYAPLDYNRSGVNRLPQPQLDVEQGELPDVNVDDRVLVDSLDAIVIIDTADKLLTDPSIDDLAGIHYDFDDAQSLVFQRSIRSIIQRNHGHPITLRRLNALSRDLILQYRKCKQPIVDVQIPEQRITGGTVQLVVVETRIGQVRVEPGCHFDCQETARWIEDARPGRKIYEP